MPGVATGGSAARVPATNRHKLAVLCLFEQRLQRWQSSVYQTVIGNEDGLADAPPLNRINRDHWVIATHRRLVHDEIDQPHIGVVVS